MASEPDLGALYSSLAQARLNSAESLLLQHPQCHIDNGLRHLIARRDMAMLIWSAAVDIGSSFMIQEEQSTPAGNSREITAFITRTLAGQFPLLELRTLWRGLVWLHNVQHRADHQPARFVLACRSSLYAFSTINHLLMPTNQPLSSSYEWLITVGDA